MKVKLWIDDYVRAPDDWHWVRNNTDAIRVLDDPNLEVVELAIDHDIAHETVTGTKYSCEENFQATARFIRAKQLLKQFEARENEEPLLITIQTGSISGREALGLILYDLPNTKVEVSYQKKPHDWLKS